MDPARVGSAFRRVRLQKTWSQAELARRAGVPRRAVINAENGRIGRLAYDDLDSIAGALEGHLDVRFRWRGEEMDRLINADHSAMHEEMAAFFTDRAEWTIASEVTFAIYAERGVIDILAYHPATRRLLVIELKTLIVDVQQLLGSTDRYRRLARQVARERGWDPSGVSAWVIVAATRTNERRISAHLAVLRNAFPLDGRAIQRWLRHPDRDVAALSTVTIGKRVGGRPVLAGRKRASPKPRSSNVPAGATVRSIPPAARA